MPDRLPPSWGHEPEDGRDLDALLSAQMPLSVEEILTDEALLAGQLAGVSDAQRPVAGAMFALRAAPAGSELAGEAAARAAFRALLEPAGPEPQHTLVLPVPAAGQGPRPAARHRHRRRAAGGRGGWQVMALAGTAAAVVAVGAAALAGTFSGSAGHRGQSANPSAVQLSTRPGSSPAGTHPLVLGNATKDQTPSATPTASATPGATPSPGAAQTHADLCLQYFESHSRHSRGDRTKEKELFAELSRLAGSSRNIDGYCAQQLDSLWSATPRATSSWSGFPFAGSGGGDAKPDSGAGAGQEGSAKASSGSADSGSGNGGSR